MALDYLCIVTSLSNVTFSSCVAPCDSEACAMHYTQTDFQPIRFQPEIDHVTNSMLYPVRSCDSSEIMLWCNRQANEPFTSKHIGEHIGKTHW